MVSWLSGRDGVDHDVARAEAEAEAEASVSREGRPPMLTSRAAAAARETDRYMLWMVDYLLLLVVPSNAALTPCDLLKIFASRDTGR